MLASVIFDRAVSILVFSLHTTSIWDFKTIFQRGEAENDEIPKSSFPFQPPRQNGKKVESSEH